MKFLFDQNLSHRLVAQLMVEFPGSAHVRDFGLARAADPLVWAHAAAQGFVIVSKDVDFLHRALLLGPPPKVVWIRLGNCLTAEVATLLRSQHATLLAFEADPSASFIALG
jgi:predicted nuclease of predicted toxin-antitoxin system